MAGTQEQADRPRLSWRVLLAAPAVAVVSTFVLALLVAQTVSVLPRSTQGEAVVLPFSLCLAAAAFLQVVVPSGATWLLLKGRRARRYVTIWVLLSAALWLFLVGPTLYKAWNRGL